jgi:hypothetical protein
VNQDQQRVIEVLDVLYGDGAYEITKAMTKQQKNQQTQARVGLASNVVGLGAGIAGTAAALRAREVREAAFSDLQQEGPCRGDARRWCTGPAGSQHRR